MPPPISLAPYQLPLRPAPAAVLDAARLGVREGVVPPCTEAERVLGAATPPANGVVRDAVGRVLVTCVTDLPGVTPAMIDWWFGWHLPSTARYALWHPQAHRAARVREDRSAWTDDRAKYRGNVSYVDEYIGASLKKLAIAFVDPRVFALHRLDDQRATAICATTSDRRLGGEGGCLVHYVVPTASGAQMRSGFWLGEIRHHHVWVDRLTRRLLNTRAVRRAIVSDRMALDLLIHCGEEMNHLARFLPRLYTDVHADVQVHAGASTQAACI